MSSSPDYLSFSDSWRAAIEILAAKTREIEEGAGRIIAVFDLRGRLRLLWMDRRGPVSQITQALAVLGAYFDHEVWDVSSEDDADRVMFEDLWREGTAVHGTPSLRVVSRHTQLSGWFQPGHAQARKGSNAVVAFTAAKGGLGRSTALVGLALDLVAAGRRVVAVDFDFAAPGITGLLTPSPESRAHLGVLDYLLDKAALGDVELSRYLVRAPIAEASLFGDLRVMPVSGLNTDLLEKLARVDVSLRFDASGMRQELNSLVWDLHESGGADVVLIDTPPGINDTTGAVVSDVEPIVVHFADHSPHGLISTRFAARGAGRDRLTRGLRQLPFVVCQGMVPARAASESLDSFAAALLDLMETEYLTSSGDTSEWSIHDVDSLDGPHIPRQILYSERVALADSARNLAAALENDSGLAALYSRVEELLV